MYPYVLGIVFPMFVGCILTLWSCILTFVGFIPTFGGCIVRFGGYKTLRSVVVNSFVCRLETLMIGGY